jgi:hypothetical protein
MKIFQASRLADIAINITLFLCCLQHLTHTYFFCVRQMLQTFFYFSVECACQEKNDDSA